MGKVQWWRFWSPDSGLIGGLILALISITAFTLISVSIVETFVL